MASIARLDRVKSIYVGNIESVVHTAELQNGNVVKLGTYVAGQRDLRNVVVPAAGDGALFLVYTSEINDAQALSTDAALENFVIPAGKAARAYELQRGDIFSVTQDGLTLIATDAVKGNKVVAQVGVKLKEVTTVTTEKFVGSIVDIEVLGTTTIVGGAGSIARINKYVVIEVLSN